MLYPCLRVNEAARQHQQTYLHYRCCCCFFKPNKNWILELQRTNFFILDIPAMSKLQYFSSCFSLLLLCILYASYLIKVCVRKKPTNVTADAN